MTHRLHTLSAPLVTAACLACFPTPPAASPDGGAAPTDAGPCGYSELPVPPVARHTPRWAFEPWISKDISTGADTRDFVAGFKQRDIPVGVVVIDSPWETHYNTFIPNPSRYPDFGQLVSDLRAQGVRTVLWVTQMVNDSSFDVEPGGDTYEGESPNFQEAWLCGFLVNDGATYLWWKGTGGGLDFFNPSARAWWHRQQDALLDQGLAGWKLDFGDSYIPGPTVLTSQGNVPHQEYSEAYYRDFLEYGVHRRGAEEFVTMVRPYDKSYQFPGRFFARPEHTPVGWVGDNRRDWIGLEDALDHLFRSAAAGYVVIGSDIGGYLDVDDANVAGDQIPFSQEVFARWTAVGSLNPFMQLHGRANITPWTVPERVDETVALYRYWSKLHHELVPFFYSLAEEAYAQGGPILHPVGAPEQWPGDYRYLLGQALLVAPILDDTGARDVELPAGAGWVDWWSDGATVHPGGTTLAAYAVPDRARIPVFIREGAIIPLDISDDVTGLAGAAHTDHLTLLVYPGAASTFVLHDEDGATTTIQAVDSGMVTLSLSRARAPVYARIRTGAISAVTRNADAMTRVATKTDLDGQSAGYTSEGVHTWVKVAASDSPVEIVLSR